MPITLRIASALAIFLYFAVSDAVINWHIHTRPGLTGELRQSFLAAAGPACISIKPDDTAQEKFCECAITQIANKLSMKDGEIYYAAPQEARDIAIAPRVRSIIEICKP